MKTKFVELEDGINKSKFKINVDNIAHVKLYCPFGDENGENDEWIVEIMLKQIEENDNRIELNFENKRSAQKQYSELTPA